MSIENGMVVGLGDALEKHYRAIDGTALEFATQQVLCDVDTFTDNIGAECIGRTDVNAEADRALRMPHRLEESDSAVVLAALLLAAHRNDAADTLRAARLLVQRHLESNADRIARIAGGEE